MTAISALDDELLTIAISAARLAGDCLLGSDSRQRTVRAKRPGRDYVSNVDVEVETLIAERIRAARSGDAILGEEGTQIDGGPLRWILDPIDGTTNFIRGLPGFVISIAVLDEADSILGVVFDPVHDQMFAAARTLPSQCNGEAIVVADTLDVGAAIIGTGFAADNDARQHQAATLRSFLTRAGDVRSSGVCSYDCCQVAAGRLDAYYESGLDVWDYAAGAFIAQKAGAEVRTYPTTGVAEEMLLVSAPGILADVEAILTAEDAS